jgi:hypothetical protein
MGVTRNRVRKMLKLTKIEREMEFYFQNADILQLFIISVCCKISVAI